MNPKIAQQSPMRPPHWRYLRLVEVMRSRRQPARLPRDYEHSIQRARRMFRELTAASGNERLLDEVKSEFSDIWHSHEIFYGNDSLTRQMLEAHLLLPDMPFEEIAERLGVEVKTIQYFADLYFDVADRRTCEIWIQKVVRGDFDPNRSAGSPNSDDAARGYMLRFLALRGGRHVLDTVLCGLRLASLPQSSEKKLDAGLMKRFGKWHGLAR